MKLLPAIALTVAAAFLGACHKTGAENPRLRVSDRDLTSIRAELTNNPAVLERPVVVLAGLGDPGLGSADIAMTLAKLTSGNIDDFVVFSSTAPANFQESAVELTELVNKQLNDGNPAVETPEVDVVALSLGGVTARHATIPSVRWVRLDANRMFTLAAPHTGANVSEHFGWVDETITDLKPGSPYLAWLDENDPEDYELFPYAVKDDGVVGEEHTTPTGWEGEPLWVRGRTWGSHQFVHRDEMILTDIALRLRGEEPLFTGPVGSRVGSETPTEEIETTSP